MSPTTTTTTTKKQQSPPNKSTKKKKKTLKKKQGFSLGAIHNEQISWLVEMRGTIRYLGLVVE